jgi:OOP family OmpA-OmpF porin
MYYNSLNNIKTHTNMKMKFALIAATLFAATAAQASDVYVGAGVGQSRLKGVDANDIGRGISLDSKDTAGKIFVGNQFTKNFALEASYFDLGDFTATNRFGTSASVGARGFGLDAVGTLPLTQKLDALGRVGVTRTRLDGSLAGFNDHKNVTEPKAGLGLQYKLTDNLKVRGEYEVYRTNTSYNRVSERSHVNVASVSLVYSFGRPVIPAYSAPIVRKETVVAPAPVAAPAPAYVPPAPAPEPMVTTKKVRE